MHHTSVEEPLGPVCVARQDSVDAVSSPRPVHLGDGLATDAEGRLIHFGRDCWVVEDDEAEAVVRRGGDPLSKPRGLLGVPVDAVRLSVVGVEEEEVHLPEGDVVVAGDAEEGLEGPGLVGTVPVVVADRGEEVSGADPASEELPHVGLVGGDAHREGIHVVSHGDDRLHAVESHVSGGPQLHGRPVAEVTDHADAADGSGGDRGDSRGREGSAGQEGEGEEEGGESHDAIQYYPQRSLLDRHESVTESYSSGHTTLDRTSAISPYVVAPMRSDAPLRSRWKIVWERVSRERTK